MDDIYQEERFYGVSLSGKMNTIERCGSLDHIWTDADDKGRVSCVICHADGNA